MSVSIRIPRTVTRPDGHFQVSDDPDNVLGYLLGCLASQPFIGEAAQRFAPDGQGLAIPDTMVAVLADPSDWIQLPVEQVPAEPDGEWWLVSLQRPHDQPGSAVVIIEGDELRDLLRAAGLWS